MTYFKSITTLAELKATYRTLALIHHPDKGGNLEVMKAINNEYETLFEQLKKAHNEEPKNKEKQMHETPDQFRDIVVALMNLADLEIELCGEWLWISGNTRAVKDELKALGCLWASKKMMWYWRAEQFKTPFNRKAKSMSEIRNKYGSQNIKYTPDLQLT